MTGADFTWIIGGLLVALLAWRISLSIRKVLTRPSPTPAALTAYSLTIGRAMLLIGVLGHASLSPIHQGPYGTRLQAFPLVSVIALMLLYVSEGRWPRQSGQVRTARLHRPTFRETVDRRYRTGTAVMLGLIAVAGVFFWCVNPSVTRPVTTGWWTFYSSTVDSTGLTDTSFDTRYLVEAMSRSDLALTGAGLALVAVLAALAVRRVLRRPNLAGVTDEFDQVLRRVSAHRAIRAAVATALAGIEGATSNLQAALTGDPETSALHSGLDGFLTWVQIGCAVALFVLYIVGPDERWMRRQLPAASSV